MTVAAKAAATAAKAATAAAATTCREFSFVVTFFPDLMAYVEEARTCGYTRACVCACVHVHVWGEHTKLTYLLPWCVNVNGKSCLTHINVSLYDTLLFVSPQVLTLPPAAGDTALADSLRDMEKTETTRKWRRSSLVIQCAVRGRIARRKRASQAMILTMDDLSLWSRGQLSIPSNTTTTATTPTTTHRAAGSDSSRSTGRSLGPQPDAPGPLLVVPASLEVIEVPNLPPRPPDHTPPYGSGDIVLPPWCQPQESEAAHRDLLKGLFEHIDVRGVGVIDLHSFKEALRKQRRLRSFVGIQRVSDGVALWRIINNDGTNFVDVHKFTAFFIDHGRLEHARGAAKARAQQAWQEREEVRLDQEKAYEAAVVERESMLRHNEEARWRGGVEQARLTRLRVRAEETMAVQLEQQRRDIRGDIDGRTQRAEAAARKKWEHEAEENRVLELEKMVGAACGERGGARQLCKRLFDSVDTDHDGSVTVDELQAALGAEVDVCILLGLPRLFFTSWGGGGDERSGEKKRMMEGTETHEAGAESKADAARAAKTRGAIRSILHIMFLGREKKRGGGGGDTALDKGRGEGGEDDGGSESKRGEEASRWRHQLPGHEQWVHPNLPLPFIKSKLAASVRTQRKLGNGRSSGARAGVAGRSGRRGPVVSRFQFTHYFRQRPEGVLTLPDVYVYDDGGGSGGDGGGGDGGDADTCTDGGAGGSADSADSNGEVGGAGDVGDTSDVNELTSTLRVMELSETRRKWRRASIVIQCAVRGNLVRSDLEPNRAVVPVGYGDRHGDQFDCEGGEKEAEEEDVGGNGEDGEGGRRGKKSTTEGRRGKVVKKKKKMKRKKKKVKKGKAVKKK